MLLVTKPDRVVTYNEELFSIKLIRYISKLGKVVSCNKVLPHIKSNDPLNARSHEVRLNTLYLCYRKASGH